MFAPTKLSTLLLLIPVAAVLLAGCRAEDEVDAPAAEGDGYGDMDDEDDEDEDLIPEDEADKPDMACNTVFVNKPSTGIPAGTEIKLLVGIHNIANRPFNIKNVRASIRNPADFSYVLQNFTVSPVGITVDGGEQATSMYKFTPGVTIEPRDVAFEVVVEYSDDDDGVFSAAAYNGTITISDSEQPFDPRSIVKLFISLGFAAFMIYYFFLGQEQSEKLMTETVERGTATTKPEDDDWLAETKSSKATGAGKKKKGKK